jgi:hypothetical protein
MLSDLTFLVIIPDLAGIPVTDQGVRPICVALAMTGAHEIARSKDNNAPVVLLSPEAVWGHAWERGLAGPDGTYLFAIADALQDRGQPELSKWPLNPGGQGWSAHPKETGPPPWFRSGFTELPLDLPLLEAEVAAGHPVVLLVHVTDEFQNADGTSGRIESPSADALRQGLHAVLCVGHAKDHEDSSHFLIRNSWGSSWGNGGYAWLPWDYVANFATQMGRIGSVL